MAVEAETLLERDHWYREPAIFVRHIIWRYGYNRLNVLTFPASGGRLLPVFSDEYAARSFLRLGAFGGGWQVRESTAGELISLLVGQAGDVEWVVLDPPSGLVSDPDVAVGCASKREFIDSLMDEPLVLPH